MTSPTRISKAFAPKTQKAKYGKNKQNHNDSRQVAVGMAFDENGFPLAHEVFEGNISDTKTLRRILARLALPEDGLKPVVILDAGFGSAEYLTLIRELGYSSLINITRGCRQKAEEFAASGFERLPDRAENQQVEVRKITDPEDAQSVLVLCRSAQRRLKEVAMISTAEQRFLKNSERLQAVGGFQKENSSARPSLSVPSEPCSRNIPKSLASINSTMNTVFCVLSVMMPGWKLRWNSVAAMFSRPITALPAPS